jgi:hypothetical protein
MYGSCIRGGFRSHPVHPRSSIGVRNFFYRFKKQGCNRRLILRKGLVSLSNISMYVAWGSFFSVGGIFWSNTWLLRIRIYDLKRVFYYHKSCSSKIKKINKWKGLTHLLVLYVDPHALFNAHSVFLFFVLKLNETSALFYYISVWNLYMSRRFIAK